MNVYTVYDTVADTYIGVYLGDTDGQFIRAFLPQMSYHMLNINSANIYCIGTFDDKEGIITLTDKRRVQWSAFDYEQHMPDTVLQGVKNQGVIPSDEKFVNAKVVGSQLSQIAQKLGIESK